MGEYVIKLPDVGEGVAEAELVEWYVKVGDIVREDTVLAAVMTDKATVEIPSPVEGEIVWTGASVGDTVAVGSPIIRLRIASDGTVAEQEPSADVAKAQEVPASAARISPEPSPREQSGRSTSTIRPVPDASPRREGKKPLAPPSVRLRAKEAGVDLRQVDGLGPAGRIRHEDLDAFLELEPVVDARAPTRSSIDSVEEIKVVGLRRKIAERMSLSKSRIPHITYVEEFDLTALEDLRTKLNDDKRSSRTRLSLLPFVMRAMVQAISEQPHLNALFDDDEGVVRRHSGVHVGIATQTPNGLVVPVVKHTEARDLWDCAAELARLAAAARSGTVSREELSGSTITITSLGALGGIVTTPVINRPEVAIIGINKMAIRPTWNGDRFVPRKMMNVSSSFDHRVIDGWDAAVFIQRIKALIETPALLFLPS